MRDKSSDDGPWSFPLATPNYQPPGRRRPTIVRLYVVRLRRMNRRVYWNTYVRSRRRSQTCRTTLLKTESYLLYVGHTGEIVLDLFWTEIATHLMTGFKSMIRRGKLSVEDNVSMTRRVRIFFFFPREEEVGSGAYWSVSFFGGGGSARKFRTYCRARRKRSAVNVFDLLHLLLTPFFPTFPHFLRILFCNKYNSHWFTPRRQTRETFFSSCPSKRRHNLYRFSHDFFPPKKYLIMQLKKSITDLKDIQNKKVLIR